MVLILCRGDYKAQREAQEALEIVSLVISCCFMAELLLSIWALGLR